jgi:PhnB protein
MLRARKEFRSMQLEPYIFFHGTCEEALNFYVKCFGGEITMLSRFEGSPMEQHVSPDFKDKIMHASFVAGDLKFMASDGRPGNPPDGEDDIVLCIATSDAAQGERVFNALAEGGKIDMPLQDQFWGAKLGSLTDRFGIQWMVSINS